MSLLDVYDRTDTVDANMMDAAAAGGAGAAAAAGVKKVVLKGPRACSTCARAKSRCIAGPARQEKCERQV